MANQERRLCRLATLEEDTLYFCILQDVYFLHEISDDPEYVNASDENHQMCVHEYFHTRCCN